VCNGHSGLDEDICRTVNVEYWNVVQRSIPNDRDGLSGSIEQNPATGFENIISICR